MEHFKKVFVAVAVLGVLVGGCSSLDPEMRRQGVPLAYSQCPVLKKYTREELLAAAKEMRSLPSESQLAAMMTDYSKLRDACRVARKELKRIYPNK